jgi:hypothetical protein
MLELLLTCAGGVCCDCKEPPSPELFSALQVAPTHSHTHNLTHQEINHAIDWSDYIITVHILTLFYTSGTSHMYQAVLSRRQWTLLHMRSLIYLSDRLVTFGHFWPLLATFGHFWPPFGQRLATVGHLWPLFGHRLVTLGHYWPLLATFGYFLATVWSLLATFGHFGHFWLLFGHRLVTPLEHDSLYSAHCEIWNTT